jgi:hypothetical protein
MSSSKSQLQDGQGCAPGILDHLAALTSGGSAFLTTAHFGRSLARQAAYRLRNRRPDLDFTLSWQLFASLVDWANRWPAEQHAFAAGLIL